MQREHESAATLIVAAIIDAVAGEPPACIHPVVGLGKLIQCAEQFRPHDNPRRELAWGVGVVAAIPAIAALVSCALGRMLRPCPAWLRITIRGCILSTLASWRMLDRAVAAVHDQLKVRDIDSAREKLSWLVSRDRSDLSTSEIVAASIESIAENTSDSIVAPLMAYWAFGLTGCAAYRAINTLDAMIGYHGEYEYAGKPSAKIDDVVNFVPARVTAALIACVQAHHRDSLHVAVSDHDLTESPNAGWPMSAMAGALNVTLSKPGHYALNPNGREPEAADLNTSRRIVRRTAVLAVILAATAMLLQGRTNRQLTDG